MEELRAWSREIIYICVLRTLQLQVKSPNSSFCIIFKMFLFGVASLLVAFAAAQTPPGFTPNVTAHLDVIYPSAAITPGLSMSKTSWYINVKGAILDLIL